MLNILYDAEKVISVTSIQVQSKKLDFPFLNKYI